MAKETAEQKLLKLIETTEAQQSAPAGGDSGQGQAPAQTSAPAASEAQKVLASVKSTGLPSFSPQAVLGFFQQIIIGIKGGAGGGGAAAFGLRELNMLLMAVVGVFLIIVVMTFTGGLKLSKQAIEFSVKKNITPAIGPYFIPKEIDKYIKNISRRNIFQPVEEEVVEEVPVEEKKVVQITEKTSSLKLVGVSWLDSAETATAMIEDQSQSITHFLKMGDEINGVKIETIYTDRVKLTLDGEETMLSL